MAKSPDWTMITMPYDLTVDTNKISDSCLPPRVLEITSNGSYNVIPYTRAEVTINTDVPRCAITIVNNSSNLLKAQTVQNTGYKSIQNISAGTTRTIYGLKSASGHIENYTFLFDTLNDPIKGVCDFGTVVFTSVRKSAGYAVAVTVDRPVGDPEMTITITDDF